MARESGGRWCAEEDGGCGEERGGVEAAGGGGGGNVVYRALTAADAKALAAGRGLTAKAPRRTWTAAEHVANAGPGAGGAAASSPWISTTQLRDVARAYDSGHGIVRIDLSKVPSTQVEVWRHAPRVNGVEGLPYHRLIWAQEVTVFQSIPVRRYPTGPLMTDLSNEIAELKREISVFTVPLQTVRELHSDRFEVVAGRVEAITRRLKGVDILPRDLLNEVYFFGQVLRNEAQHNEALSPMADRVEFLFGLMLKGETPGDRVPGRPRII